MRWSPHGRNLICASLFGGTTHPIPAHDDEGPVRSPLRDGNHDHPPKAGIVRIIADSELHETIQELKDLARRMSERKEEQVQ
jgi:hypothetical protein